LPVQSRLQIFRPQKRKEKISKSLCVSAPLREINLFESESPAQFLQNEKRPCRINQQGRFEY